MKVRAATRECVSRINSDGAKFVLPHHPDQLSFSSRLAAADTGSLGLLHQFFGHYPRGYFFILLCIWSRCGIFDRFL